MVGLTLAWSRTASTLPFKRRPGQTSQHTSSSIFGGAKKIELKLTGIARGSLMEVQRDYKKHSNTAISRNGRPDIPR